MDTVLDWAAYFTGEDVQTLSYARRIFSAASTLKSYLVPLIDQLSKKPDLATVALLLVIVLISMKILDVLYKSLIFWLRMLWRAVFWVGLIGLALWMYTRGPAGVADDVQHWYYLWKENHAYWEDQQRRAAQLMQQQMGGGGLWR